MQKIFFILFLTSCASLSPSPEVTKENVEQEIPSFSASRENNNNLKVETDALQENQYSSGQRSKIPAVERELVKKWIQYFSVKDHARFQRYLDRGSVYKGYRASVARIRIARGIILFSFD